MDENMTQSILQRLTKIETILEVDLKNLKDKVENDYKNMDARINKIESNNLWIVRSIIASIIIAVGTLILK